MECFYCFLFVLLSTELITLSFFTSDSASDRWTAFRLMNDGHKELKGVKGQSFYKLLGTGRGDGFNPWPDWSTYALLQVWFNDDYANEFFENSPLMKTYSQISRIKTFRMRCFNSHGFWSGKQPFTSTGRYTEGRVGVITRATIRPSRLIQFWRHVPDSQRPLESAEGLLFKKGIGEVPVLQMATFSVWDSLQDVKRYAYKSVEHQKVIQKTRELNWYKEELFARFFVESISAEE